MGGCRGSPPAFSLHHHHVPIRPHPPLGRRWCLQVADAIAYLHTLGITHGDLKLENIMLSGDPAQPRSTYESVLVDLKPHRFVLQRWGAVLTLRFWPVLVFIAAWRYGWPNGDTQGAERPASGWEGRRGGALRESARCFLGIFSVKPTSLLAAHVLARGLEPERTCFCVFLGF
jgi:serine/threonine protein kinase